MFTVVDGDMGVDGVVNYTLVSAPDDHFTLDPVSGTLTLVQEVDFDTEVFSSIFLTMDVEIAACDRHTPLSACPQIDVLLYLIAENDNSPGFVQDLYTVDIIETAPINTLLYSHWSVWALTWELGEYRALIFWSPPQRLKPYSVWGL